MKFLAKVHNMQVNKGLNFWWIRIRIITDPHTDTDPDMNRDTDKTCLGGGMHCPSASSYISGWIYIITCFKLCQSSIRFR